MASSSGTVVTTARAAGGSAIEPELPNARLWSPDDPDLYDLSLKLVRGGTAVDSVESYFGMRKTSLDRDADGLTDAEEYALGTDPLDDDSDADGLTDFDEVRTHGSDPLVVDTDGYDAMTGPGSIVAERGEATYIASPSVSGWAVRLSGYYSTIELELVDLSACEEARWHMQVLRGDVDAPEDDDDLALQVWDFSAFEDVFRMQGTGAQETSFTAYSGTIDTRWLTTNREFRVISGGDRSNDDDFVIDDLAIGCDEDGDGLATPLENLKHGTDPNDADSDNDLVDDGDEIANGTDPLNPFSN
jgi:hypothetical protein